MEVMVPRSHPDAAFWNVIVRVVEDIERIEADRRLPSRAAVGSEILAEREVNILDPGPRSVLRPECQKSLSRIGERGVLNHWLTDGFATEGSPTKLGYHFPGLPESEPLCYWFRRHGEWTARFQNKQRGCLPAAENRVEYATRFMNVRPLPKGSW